MEEMVAAELAATKADAKMYKNAADAHFKDIMCACDQRDKAEAQRDAAIADRDRLLQSHADLGAQVAKLTEELKAERERRSEVAAASVDGAHAPLRIAPWSPALGDNPAHPSEETIQAVIGEVWRARQKFPGSRFLNTALGEEVGELSKAFLQRRRDRAKGSIYAEAMQVAAVAIRIMEESDPVFDDVTDAEALP